ncbi:MAG: hypothetical protein J6B12_02745, partial [Clostridia bacterium]|nr:hypothetical protein [Clostridia bacterium]
YFGILGTFFGVPIYAIICSLVRSWVNSGLKKKELSTELADYYPDGSLVDPKEQKEKKHKNIFTLLGAFFCFLFNKSKQFFAFCLRKIKEVKKHRDEKRNNQNKK